MIKTCIQFLCMLIRALERGYGFRLPVKANSGSFSQQLLIPLLPPLPILKTRCPLLNSFQTGPSSVHS